MLLLPLLAHAAPTVLRAEDVDWQQLNPARGDASPKAATLWGDCDGTGATGFLVQFVDGFSSPPHIHNVSYRGVVIRGEVHNAHPDAPAMWMSAPSFWTQPKGAVHITAAKGSPVVAYIEIEQGPYLVRPVDKAFETPERPVNVDASNLVWLDDVGGSAVSYLWGKPDDAHPSGALLRLPQGFAGSITGRIRGVTIAGRTTHGVTALEPGSTFTTEDSTTLSCATATCVLYVRARGRFRLSKDRQ